MAVILVAIVGASFIAGRGPSNAPNQSALSATGTSYVDNGLTCFLPLDAPSYISNLVPRVAESPVFLNYTNGAPYIFEDATNITDRTETVGGTVLNGPTQNGVVGGTTINLPPVVELTFYSFGPRTSCGEDELGAATGLIVVHVPVQNGGFDIANMEVHPSHLYIGTVNIGG